MAAKKVAKKVAKKSDYTASVKVLGKFYTASGVTVADALQNLTVANAKGTAVLTLSRGAVKVERIIPRVIVARLFALSPTMRQMAIRQTAARFDL